MIAWWRRWRRAKRLTKAKESGELREFIYLDGVSVYSLLASRLGPVAQEVTDSYSRSSEAEAAGKIGGDLLALNAESSFRASFNRSSGSEILRKSIIQASFKDLVDLEQDRLVLGGSGKSRQGGGSKKPMPFKVAPFAAAEFARGRLLEVDVELDVEPIYRMNTVLSSMIGIASASPDLFDAQTRFQFSQGRAIEVALQGLLGGLVPIRARVPDYVVRSINGVDSVDHVRALSPVERAGSYPLYLVGVAEESLFWKDVRRVLFSGGRYTVLARVSAPGVQETWNPVKLSHVLDSFAPDLGVQINKMSTMALKGAKKPSVSDHSSRSLGALLGALLRRLNERASSLTPDQAAAGQVVVHRYASTAYSIEGWRAASDELVEVMFPVPADRPEREEMATLRQQVQSANAAPRPGLAGQGLDNDAHEPAPERYLDCEFVAIYW